jgi:hypothetical protein
MVTVPQVGQRPPRRVSASTRGDITALPGCAATDRSKSPLTGPQAYHPPRRVMLSRAAHRLRERVVAMKMVFSTAVAAHTPQLGRRQ